MVPPTPSNIVRIELSGTFMALKLAGNSMNADCAFKLKGWLGVDPLRPSVYCTASLLRAAWKTFQGYEEMHNELISLAVDCQNLASIFSPIPPGWDSPAFVTNLTNASSLTNLSCGYKSTRELLAIKKVAQGGSRGAFLAQWHPKGKGAPTVTFWAPGRISTVFWGPQKLLFRCRGALN